MRLSSEFGFSALSSDCSSTQKLRHPLLLFLFCAALSSDTETTPPSPPFCPLRRPLLRHRSVCAALSSDCRLRFSSCKIVMEQELLIEGDFQVLGDSSSSNGVDTPQVGMCFSAEEEVRDFYKSYAQSLGFGISKLGSKKGDDGQLKYFSFGCSKNAAKDVLKKAYYNMIAIIDQSLQDLERKVVY
ncbi:hypothetical protein ZIOFF_071922 [Zingiber officinale]|uniref:Protein FAR1-RELATED SEQUENCE n=1 Tax=Zingiber officinale TaxID=94328 RepID=A0A8J5CAB2_ZINOF|nr:hypothetical protein ZIOFF_071922 [Zingiber officinale]